jgi:DNA mismatch endonuclease (patch repair protein)
MEVNPVGHTPQLASSRAGPAARPRAASAQVAAQMSRMPRRDSAPEVALRRELFRRGLRFRTHLPLPGRPDVCFTRARLAVFVDGCFWHRCPQHATSPRNNGQWWQDKLEANVQRDARQGGQLRDLGWTVLRIWEHEDPVAAADLVERSYRQLLGLPERAAT